MRSWGLNCLGPGDLRVEGPGLCLKAEGSSEVSSHPCTDVGLGKGAPCRIQKSCLQVPGHCYMTP